ncbi:MAG: RNA polymerase sigma factor [Bacteroidales bacterium]|nr:RNA polymerase sigma factor [Bacteroidales bacterium]
MSSQRLSFPEIARMYQQQLYWYIRRIVLVHEDAEDILQDTFIKAYRNLWKLRNSDALKPWLYRIATNEINRYFRKRREVVPMEHLPDSEPAGTDTVTSGKVAEIISSAFLQMSPLQREVFSLKYYEDLDYVQISRITGSSTNTLMVSYHEARKKIEKEINR